MRGIRDIEDQLKQMKAASRLLMTLSREQKDRVLQNLSKALEENINEILDANRQDLASLDKTAGLAFRDRLELNEKRIQNMAKGVATIAKLADPVGEIVESQVLPNGVQVFKKRVPLGIIFLIFESRPNVAVDAFALSFKAGNALILKGGKESKNSTEVIYRLIEESLQKESLPSEFIWGLPEASRQEISSLLKKNEFIDVVIPRGGESLIRSIEEQSKMPIIKNDRGLCHIYVDSTVSVELAVSIIENAKTQRPGVCNAIETILVHEGVPKIFWEKLSLCLNKKNVRWKCCDKSAPILMQYLPANVIEAADSSSWDTEYLDLILNCKVVSGLDEALAHILRHGSRHSEAILTENFEHAQRFLREVDAAHVYWNASTRFSDGGELGLGGEIGISTQKLHVRGPVGLRELTCVRWVLIGSGQIRGG